MSTVWRATSLRASSACRSHTSFARQESSNSQLSLHGRRMSLLCSAAAHLEPSCLAFEDQRLVNDALVVGRVLSIQPPLQVRIPPGMSYPLAQISGEPGPFVDAKFCFLLLPIEKGSPQFIAERFVSIQRINPFVAGLRDREVPLIPEIRPHPINDLCAVRARDFCRSIGAAAIHNDDFVG